MREPTPGRPAAALPASLNVHASRSPDTFAAEITASGATRVLPISPFGYGHDPDGVAAPGNAEVTGAGLLELLELAAAAARGDQHGYRYERSHLDKKEPRPHLAHRLPKI